MDAQSPAEKERRYVWRAGILVFVGLLLAGGGVFLIGRESGVFRRALHFRAAFENVEGLGPDAPVWLGGLEVGRVRGVRVKPRPDGKNLEIDLEVFASYRQWVREDSVARIKSRGLLGDKAIDLSLGSPEARPLDREELIESADTDGYDALVRNANKILEESSEITGTLRDAVNELAAPEVREEVTATLGALKRIVEQVERGSGALHALVYDPRLAERLPELVAALTGAAQRLDGTMAEVDQLLGDVRTGDGSAHALFYERGAVEAFERIGKAAGELGALLEEARNNPDSALYATARGDSGNMIAELGQAAQNLRIVTQKVRDGEGSLGALINDPTVYEDVKQVLGNLRRNRVLRSMVRYLMSNEDKIEAAQTPVKPLEGVGGSGEENPGAK